MKNDQRTFNRLASRRGRTCEVEDCRKAVANIHCVFYQENPDVPQIIHPINLQLVCKDHAGGNNMNMLRNAALFWNKQSRKGWNIPNWFETLSMEVRCLEN